MKIEVKLKPFTVPNFVIGITGTSEAPPSFPIADMTAEALDDLCTQFRRDVFKKAEKHDPDLDRPKQPRLGEPK